MSRKKTRPADHQIHQTAVADQVTRLRAVLQLMASGSGAMALGAAHKAPDALQLSSESRAVTVAR